MTIHLCSLSHVYAIKGEREAVVRMHMAIEDASGRESTAGVVPSANGR